MAPGVTVAVIGAIFTFAVRTSPTGIVNWRVVGVILMIAGALLIWHSRRGTTRERIVTRIPASVDPDAPQGPITENQPVREIIQERDFE